MSKYLSDVIADVESSDNPFELRFEASLYQKDPAWVAKQVPAIQKSNGYCDASTALMIACTSWGTYQLLGANIYSLGFAKPIMNFASEADQDALFQQFIAPEGYSSTEDISGWSEERFTAFATFYNGPDDGAAYVASMKKEAGMA
jgi:hypothetical protein